MRKYLLGGSVNKDIPLIVLENKVEREKKGDNSLKVTGGTREESNHFRKDRYFYEKKTP